MNHYAILFIILLLSSFVVNSAFAQTGNGSPFERKFQDVKFLDAYFGTKDKKMEIKPGDKNVPFTVVFANVGTTDIAGIKGQLSLPMGFSSADGKTALILADSDNNALAGETFYMTFFVNVDQYVIIKQYPATVKVEYSRVRESGTRNSFFDFDFKVTGTSVINVKALDPILLSLKQNHVKIEIHNDGTAPISGVTIKRQNTEDSVSPTTDSSTRIEKVVILNSEWTTGSIGSNESKFLEADIYVPESFKGDTLRVPLSINYFNAQGDRITIDRIVDFFVKGLIEVSIYDIEVIDLSGKPTLIGNVINEGNDDALFGFVTLEPLENSNIKKSTQFVDEIDTDSPIPFNFPIEFDGIPKYGNHDVKITVRYKDSTRTEHFLTENTTINIKDPALNKKADFSYAPLIIIPIIGGAGFFIFKKFKNKKQKIEQ